VATVADLVRNRAVTVTLIVAIAAASAFVAALAALVSRMAWRPWAPGGIALPWGLVLSVAASVGVVLLARAIARPQGFAAAAGWIVGAGLVLGGRPEGDYLMAQDWLGLSFLLIAPVLVIAGAASGVRTP
jgi:hypothetical protein